jgi:hypothetical protein
MGDFTLPPIHCRNPLIPVAMRSNAWVCGLSRLLGLRVRIHRRNGWISLLSVVCCQVVSVTGRSLVQRRPTECGVSDCDREAWTLRRPCPARGCRAMKKINVIRQVLPVVVRFVSGQNVFCWLEILHDSGLRSSVC